MVAPLSQASNNSTGMSGYTSSCGAGASTSAYVGTQQLALLPGCSSSGMGEIQRSTGTTKFGGSATYTLGADVDVHSEIHYTYSLPGTGTGSPWNTMVGLQIIKDVTIKVGTSVWETIDQASMLAMAQLEMTKEEYERWAMGMGGLNNSPSTTTYEAFPLVGVEGGKLMCCVKGGYRGQLFVAAMPYQSITVKFNFSTAAACSGNDPVASATDFGFSLYTKQHILSPYERGLMQSTDILQLLGTTHHYSVPIPQGVLAGGGIQPIDLSFLNDYCTHIAVWVSTSDTDQLGGKTGTGTTAAGGGNALILDKCQFVYNGTSAQGQQRTPTLMRSSMLGLAAGGLVPHVVATVADNQIPQVQLFQLANTPCVTSLSTDQSQFAPFAGGDGVANNRYDVIQFKANLLYPSSRVISGTTTHPYVVHFVAFGAQSVLYSAGGAVRN